MKSTVESLEPTRSKLTIEVDYDELKPHMDAAYKQIAEQVNIPGFRKGHVPAALIDKRFGRGAVIEQVINEVLPQYYTEAIVENKVRPMGQPEVEVVATPAVEGEAGGELKFTAEVDVVPQFDLPKLDERVVEVESVELNEEDVQKELDSLRARFATLKPLDRPAQDGDFLTLDLDAVVGDETIDSLTEVSYELGSGEMLEGQDEALAGKSAGDEVTFKSTIRGGEHAGEEATINVKINAVKERELPEADDDFAQMVSEFDTASELLEDVKKQVSQKNRSMQAVEARDKLLEQLVDETEIVLPQSIIDQETSRRVEEDADEETKKQMQERVIHDISRQILLEELASAREIHVGQQELVNFMFQTAQNFGLDINQMFQDEAQIQNMMSELARTKAIVSVLAEATVKDSNGEVIDISEFTTAPEDEQAGAAE